MDFYPEQFDISKPPPCPPNRTVRMWPFVGMAETKESKKRTTEYKKRLDEYGENLSRKREAKNNNLDTTGTGSV